MIPSLFGLLIMLAGLVLIHYGLTETLLPLTPIQPLSTLGSPTSTR